MKYDFRPAERHPAWSRASDGEWTDWRWQMRRSLSDENSLNKVLELHADERVGFTGRNEFKVRVTPYYLGLVRANDPQDPIRRIFMPNAQELATGRQSLRDPLAEKKNSVASRIIHRYPDRVLFLVTDVCSVYCRFCTRKYFTAHDHHTIPTPEYKEALNYIREHRGIREVILSGGDPLTLSNNLVEKILCDLRQIDHVEIIRLGTRMPVVNPFRLDDELADILRRYAPVYMMTHFSHPRELTREAVQGLSRVVDKGVPVMNQFVLLSGVNNDARLIQALCRRLVYLRVKPYYMFQCDPSFGSDHLRVPLEESIAIQRELWGNLSGLAMPQLSLDIPDGGGKVSLAPNFEIARSENKVVYRGWDGIRGEYISPVQSITPSDAAEYSQEWEALKSAKIGVSKTISGQDQDLHENVVQQKSITGLYSGFYTNSIEP